jgi:hypothetical protein
MVNERNGAVARHQRRGHQQRGQELAGHIAAHRHPLRMDLAALYVQRRIADFAGIGDARADRVERIDQVADRPFMHARHAMQRVIAAGDSQRRGQRPDRGAGIAHEQVGLAHREGAAGAVHRVILAHARLLPAHAQLLQRHQHHVGIVGRQQFADPGRPFGQRRQQQRAVGNAFRARKPDRAGRVDRRLQVDGMGIALHQSPPCLDCFSAASMVLIQLCRACCAFAYTASIAAPSRSASMVRNCPSCAR